MRSIDLSLRVRPGALRDVYKSVTEESILLDAINAVVLWVWIRREKNRCSIVLACKVSDADDYSDFFFGENTYCENEF